MCLTVDYVSGYFSALHLSYFCIHYQLVSVDQIKFNSNHTLFKTNEIFIETLLQTFLSYK